MTSTLVPAADTSIRSIAPSRNSIQDSSTSGIAGQSSVAGRRGNRLVISASRRSRLSSPEDQALKLNAPVATATAQTESRTCERSTPAVAVVPDSPVSEYSCTIQQWEGVVVSRDDEEFVGRLRDLFDPEQPEQLVTLRIQDVSDAEVALIAPGAVFYWTISQGTKHHGQKSTNSTICFQRARSWTEEEAADVKRLSRKFDDFFSFHDSGNTPGA